MPSTIQSTTRSLCPGILFPLLLCLNVLTIVSATHVQAEVPRLIDQLGDADHVFHLKPPQDIPTHQSSSYQDNHQSLLKPAHQTAPLAKVLEESPSVEPARVFQDTNYSGKQGQTFNNLQSAPFPEPGLNKLRDPSSGRFSNRVSTISNTPIYPTNHLRPSENPPRTLERPFSTSAPAYSQVVPEAPSPQQQPNLLVLQEDPSQLMPQEPGPLPYRESQTTLKPLSASSTPLPGSIPLPQSSSKPIPLAPKGKAGEGQESGGLFSMFATMGGALLLVIGLFFVFAWTMKRSSTRTGGLLPQGVVEILGHQTIVGRQRVHLLRIGKRLLLVSIMPDSVETLTEITDPEEVDRIAGICCQSGKGSSTDAFQAVMRQFAQDAQISGRAPTVDQIRQRLDS